jgi:signal peptidase I
VRSLDVTFTPRTRSHRRRRLAALVVVLAVLGAGWFFLAPPSIGGQTSYVVTDGISMHPRIHTGDLALVRPVGTYHVGDIAAYRSPSLHLTVLHRIVAITRDGGYRFKGDNNTWIDPGDISRDRIIGKMWVMAPGVGGWLRRLRSPGLMSGMAVVAALLLFGGGAQVRRRRRRRPEPKWKDSEPRWEGAPAPKAAPAPAQGARPFAGRTVVAPRAPATRRPSVGPSYGRVAAAFAVVLTCAGLTAIAWSSPASRPAPTSARYVQSGRFTYSAGTIAGAVYDSDRVTTGQPMFSRLVGPVQVRFDYALRSGAVQGASGTASLAAVLSAQNGWSRTVSLEDPAPFTGRRVSLTGTVHLRHLQRLVQRVAAATAVPAESFTLTLVPSVEAHGTLAGRAFEADYAPRLPFTLTPYELAPALPTTAAASPVRAASAGAFHPSQTSAFTAEGSARVSIGPGRLHMSVSLGRILGPVGLLGAIAAAVLALRRLRGDRQADEPTRIQSRYGEAMIAAVQSTLTRGGDMVEVESIEALARLAERYGSLMIHERTDSGHAYLVADNGTVYAYFVQTDEPEPALRERLARGERLDAGASAA